MAAYIAWATGDLLSAAALLGLVALACLLWLLGSRWRGLLGAADSPAFRGVLAILAGSVGLHLLLAGLDLLHIAWSPPVVVTGLGAAILLTHELAKRVSTATAGPGGASAPDRFHWGDAMALAALVIFALLAVCLAVTTPDFILHWGLKGHRFFLAQGTDYAYLGRPWNTAILPGYPNLLPELYAISALLGGVFAEPVLMLWSVIFFALLLAAAREALRQAGTGPFLASATLAMTALVTAGAAIAGNMAGGADWLIALALVAAMPALLRAPDAAGNLQVGLAAALAAASKVEGGVLAAILVLVQGMRAAVCRRQWWRPDAQLVAALLLPAAAVVLPWVARNHHHHLSSLVVNAPSLRYLEGIEKAMRYELTIRPTWHGFSWCLYLLPLLAFRSRLRPVVAVAALQLLFYLYVYFSFPSDPVVWILTSFERLQLHLLPAILVAAGIAIEPPPAWRVEVPRQALGGAGRSSSVGG